MRIIKKASLILTITGLCITHAYAANVQPVVLELFTSQNCPSCPPADALLKKLATEDPALLLLSYHVVFPDHPGWADMYSAPVYLARQKTYAQLLNGSSMYTPQLIVNGNASMVGGNIGVVEEAIARNKKTPLALTVSLAQSQASPQLVVSIAAHNPPGDLPQADVWQIQFDRYAKMPADDASNRRVMTSINNVTGIKLIGTWRAADGDKAMYLDLLSGNGMAVIVQAQQQGTILGAGSYLKP